MKRTWTVTTAGYPPFQMVSLESELDYDGALELARSIWPECEVS